MTICVISRDNGFGLSRDLTLIETVLEDAGCDVERLGFGGDKFVTRLRLAWLRLARSWRGQTDTQIFVERIYPACLPLGRRNLLIPNPEWLLPESLPLLPQFAQILCKTRHALEIFDALGCATRYIGFTSTDRLDAGVARELRFFHLAGRSGAKGTEPLLSAWRRHPEWPTLTVVQNARTAVVAPQVANIQHMVDHVDEDRLRRMQNEHVFHICPSEAEGFGHYLVEALSVGAIVLTTDGAPMNELVTPDRGLLIPPARTGVLNLSPQYFVEVEAIENAVENALRLDASQRAEFSQRARRFFLENDAAFRGLLVEAVKG